MKAADIPDAMMNQIIYEAYTAIKQADSLNIYLQGENKMLQLPDFGELAKARNLLDSLSNDGLVAGYVNELHPADEVIDDSFMIRIGQEITLDGLQDCSFITTTYKIGDDISGNIGVIGPKRMEYQKVISQINFVRKTLNDKIKKLTE